MHADKLRILFVGEPSIDGLSLAAGAMSDEWQVQIEQDGNAALREMQAAPYDVVVADSAVSVANGTVLEEVREAFPQTVRILLASQADPASFAEVVGIAHQQLQHPFDLKALRFVVNRATVLHRLVQDPALRYILADIKSLPTLPSLYLQIVQELQSDDPSIRNVGEIVARDIGMTAKILQVANSVVMGARVNISDPVQATVQLGSDRVKALVLTVKVFDQFDAAALGDFPLNDLLDHSMVVGGFAQQICRHERASRELTDSAYTAGLLHDVGKLILAANLPDTFRQARELAVEKSMPLWLAEKEVFGATHAEVGAYLTGLWGLPDEIFEAMLDHHCPRQSSHESFDALTAVHVANALTHTGEDDTVEDLEGELDMLYLRDCGFDERIAAWRDACSTDG